MASILSGCNGGGESAPPADRERTARSFAASMLSGDVPAAERLLAPAANVPRHDSLVRIADHAVGKKLRLRDDSAAVRDTTVEFAYGGFAYDEGTKECSYETGTFSVDLTDVAGAWRVEEFDVTPSDLGGGVGVKICERMRQPADF